MQVKVGDRVTWTTRPCSGFATVYVGRLSSLSYNPEYANVSVPTNLGQQQSHRVALSRLTVTDCSEGATTIMPEPEFPPIGSIWRLKVPRVIVGPLGTVTGYEKRTVLAIDRDQQKITWKVSGMQRIASLRTWKKWAKDAERVSE